MLTGTLSMLESDVPMQVLRRAEVVFNDVQFLEDNGWREECPTLFGWLFSHPAHGVHLFEHAVCLARGTENQVSVDTTHV